MLKLLFVTGILLLRARVFGCRHMKREQGGKCERMRNDWCSDLGYNITYVSEDGSQRTSRRALREYKSLSKTCPEYFRKFSCAVYYPECSLLNVKPIWPCKSLCEKARSECEGVLQTFGFQWTGLLDCKRFPVENCKSDIGSVFSSEEVPTPAGTCEHFSIPICEDMGYNFTQLPNSLVASSTHAKLEINQYSVIFKIQCSPQLKDFVCSTFLPECTDNHETIHPCRSMCEAVKPKCDQILHQYGFSWPDALACENFPATNCRRGGITEEENVPSIVPATSCEPITVPLCRGVGYNFAHFPNSRAETQEIAGLTVHQYAPLVEVQCSRHLQEFLCSAYLPQCTEAQETIYPCRSLCERAKLGCEKLMMRFGFPWPDEIDCDNFQTTNCREVTEEESSTTIAPTTSCEPINTPICKDVGYNFTHFPNLRAETQIAAGVVVAQFLPLENLCSTFIEEFFCPAYFPECTEAQETIYPCRSLCENQKSKCEEVMTRFGFLWPDEIACDNFPTTDCGGFEAEDRQKDVQEVASCERITVPMCQDVGYQLTHVPSTRAETQNHAYSILQTYSPLIQTQCSPYLTEFLCAAHLPGCNEQQEEILPCRSLCEAAKSGCIGVMERFGFSWPDTLACNNFPVANCNRVAQDDIERDCKVLEPQACRYYGYNTTKPSNISDEIRQDLIASMEHIAKFATSECGDALERFLCSAYFPPCSNESSSPCRRMCRAVQNVCNWEIISKSLPIDIDCENLPTEDCVNSDDDIVTITTDDKEGLADRRLARMARTDVATINAAIARLQRSVTRLVAFNTYPSIHKKSLLSVLQHSITGLRYQMRAISKSLQILEEN